MIEWYFILGLLSICGWSDYREKQISCIALWFGGIGISIISLIQILSGNKLWWDSLGGAGIGIILVLLSIVTRQQIGMGDGILFVITGIGLGIANNTILLMSSLCITSVVSLALLSVKKVQRKTTVPFIPFVWLCFLIEVFCAGSR